jgi:HSP20 family molecular chaperone IbpA
LGYKDETMSRVSLFSSPFLVGFDNLEERLDRLTKAADGYPPYNIERIVSADAPERFVITIAVAGFAASDLDVVTEDNQLVVRGRQAETGERQFLHRGIAARQFQRSFLLADGMQVTGARLKDGMLAVDIVKPRPESRARRIDITAGQ